MQSLLCADLRSASETWRITGPPEAREGEWQSMLCADLRSAGETWRITARRERELG